MVLEAQVRTKWWPMLTFPPINLWSIFTMNTKAIIPIEVQKTTNFMGFENKQCEFFPCHSNVIGEHNCLFCFCPLAFLECPGPYTVVESPTDSGIYRKDCSKCKLPHEGIERSWKFINKWLENPKTWVCEQEKI